MTYILAYIALGFLALVLSKLVPEEYRDDDLTVQLLMMAFWPVLLLGIIAISLATLAHFTAKAVTCVASKIANYLRN